jgi:hypothetical protein
VFLPRFIWSKPTPLAARESERDAQVIAPVLILPLWTTETFIFPPPLTPTVTISHRRPPEPPNPRTLVGAAHDRPTLTFPDPECLANAFARRLHALFPSAQSSPSSAIINGHATSSRRRESLLPKFLKVRIVTWNMHDSLPKVSIHPYLLHMAEFGT